MKTLLQQIIYTLISGVVTFIPAMVYLGAISALEPEGFWQELIAIALGVYCLGALQICLIAGWLYFLVDYVWCRR